MFNFTGMNILQLKSRGTLSKSSRYTGSELLPQSQISDLVRGELGRTRKEAVVP
jgi:hypothetical protein